MSEDLAALALAATPGPWHAKDRGIGWAVHTGPEPEDGDHWKPGCPDLMDWDMIGKGVFEERMARYLAAANPATVLALLDRSDHAEHRTRDLRRLLAATALFRHGVTPMILNGTAGRMHSVPFEECPVAECREARAVIEEETTP